MANTNSVNVRDVCCNARLKADVVKRLFGEMERNGLGRIILKNNWCPRAKYLSAKPALEMHMNTYTNATYDCGVCHKRYAYKASLAAHMQIHQESTLDCQWPDCGKKFISNAAVKDHIMAVHQKQHYPLLFLWETVCS